MKIFTPNTLLKSDEVNANFAELQLKESVATSPSSITPNLLTGNMYCVTALANDITINAPSGVTLNGTNLVFRFKDAGVAKNITWNAIYVATGGTMPTVTIASKLVYVGFKYNATEATWDCLAVGKRP